MKIHILSDLHLEFGPFQAPDTDADVVVLAGDIHLKQHGVRWAKETFKKPVIYVPGNHEYYGGSLGKTFEHMKEEAAGSNVHLLNDGEAVIDGVRFLGATMWTDYRITGNEPLAQWDALQALSDHKRVRDEQFSKVKPFQLAAKHMRSRNFLDDAYARDFEGPTVVVTHHAPSELSIHERFKGTNSHLSAAFASNLERFMGLPKLWIHGHTHDCFDYDIYGTRVVCNPRGYHGNEINEDFNPALVVEV